MLVKVYVIFFSLLFFFYSCAHEPKPEELAHVFCECGAPITVWKKELSDNFEKLKEQGAIIKQVEDCLATHKEEYLKYKEDKKFQDEVRKKLNDECPELNGSADALFVLLFK